MSRVVAVIPARGGSRGIPRKNIKLMLEKPLIQYTIEAALNAKCIDEVYVSTEDKEIADVARSFGAKIIDRPEILAGHKISTFDVIKHANEVLNSPEIIVVLQPTSPLRSFREIDEAMMLLAPEIETVVGVCEMHNYQWDIKDDGYARPNFEARLPRQFMKRRYFENGSVYITRPNVYLSSDDKLGMGISSTGKIKLYCMSEKHSIDIDTEFDWKVMESILKFELNNNKEKYEQI